MFRIRICLLGGKAFFCTQANSMRYYSIFTEKGLLDLFNSNVIVDLPPQFVPPLEHEDILAMLRQLRSDIAKDNICGLITARHS